MDLSLGYMVVTAFALGPLNHMGPLAQRSVDVTPVISWIGPVILMFAAIVPAPPVKMLAAGLIAASLDPVGMMIARAAGTYEFGSLGYALLMHYPSYLLLGVAVVISGVVTRLGQQVTREREMGSYRLGELLGRGGMGEVYRATYRMLARPAAIKLIRPEVLAQRSGESAALAVTRFRREAEAAADLRSPHRRGAYSRHSSLHGAGDGDGRNRRWARGPLCPGVRRLLLADRLTGIRSHFRTPGYRKAHAGDPGSSL